MGLHHVAFFLPTATHCSIRFYDSIGVNLNGAADRCAMELGAMGCNVPNQFSSTVCAQKWWGGRTLQN